MKDIRLLEIQYFSLQCIGSIILLSLNRIFLLKCATNALKADCLSVVINVKWFLCPTPSVPQEQPSGVEAQIQAPSHKKSMWQNSRAAVDITMSIPKERNHRDVNVYFSIQLQSKRQSHFHLVQLYKCRKGYILPTDAGEDVDQH